MTMWAREASPLFPAQRRTRFLLIPVSYAERAAEAYRATTPEGMTGDERIQLRIIEGGTHGFMDNKEDDRYALDQMRQFLQN